LTGDARRGDGRAASAISNAAVAALAGTTGVPNAGDDAVFVALDILTRGERSLDRRWRGRGGARSAPAWRKVMRESCCREVAQLTGRPVVGFMSGNDTDPDIAVEGFILEPVA